MNDANFTATLNFSQTAEEVFNAVTNVRGWWSASLEGKSALQGDEFIYRYKDVHYSRHVLTEVVPNKKVVWLTTDASINFVDDKSEWNGTTVIFDIAEHDGKTTLTFTHQGLTPQLACYDGCSGGWNYYLNSLCDLITTGKGTPGV